MSSYSRQIGKEDLLWLSLGVSLTPGVAVRWEAPFGSRSRSRGRSRIRRRIKSQMMERSRR